MKKLLFSVTTALLLLSVFAVSAFAAAADDAKAYGQDQIRVLIKSANEDVEEKAKTNYGVRHDFNAKGFTTNVNQKQFDALQKNKNLEVSKVDKVSLEAKPGSSDARSLPSDQTPWGMEAIYNDNSIATTAGGDNIRVAVLDTGVANHVDLNSNVEQCKDFSQMRTSLEEGTCNDKNGHGTHVAGTVLADGGADGLGVYGVAPDAKLWAYKVLNDRGSGYSDDIANAIKMAADEGQANGVSVVISMSLGASSESTLISDAVTYANNNGALVVAAAGNSGPDANTIGYPGALADAVAVAALEDTQENGTYRVADFSSRGNPNTDGDYQIGRLDVEVSAPGAAIESTWYDGGYNTISGTSMATPHVSGLAAKIWAQNPGFTNTDLRTELQNRATANDILGGYGAASGDDYASGFGFPQVN
ncbi:subtilisin [Thalassobacillus cyri]|uniref:Subtilisin n=1 Tax=Thalassobacillus cyri TaxID=571932 RepID=A0A1H3XE65_9BACI|nr:S8 family serine peptidase [Thalassobacillus cyri]SDZ97646.1 subtilisin [Thalassobacillus cyri]